MNRNRVIVGSAILTILIILMIPGSIILLREWKIRQPYVSHRVPLPSLDYCSSQQVKPCILSFNQNSDGNMVINLLSDSSSSPDFYMKVRHNESESIYTCQKVKGFSSSVFCVGEAMPPGEPLQFRIISTDQDVLLAEGDFPIIGFALATPEIYSTPTFTAPPTRPPR